MKILVWGGKDQARLILSFLEEQNSFNEIFIYDPDFEFESDTFTVISNSDQLRYEMLKMDYYIVGIGGSYGYARTKIAAHLTNFGSKPWNLIHSSANVLSKIPTDCGIQIFPSVTVGRFIQFGSNVILNTGANIDHDCYLGDGVHIMGAAALAGRVEVGNFVSIGTNATILPRLRIGDGAIIGAGAVLTRNADPMGVYAGVPAKKIGENQLIFNQNSIA